MGKFLLPTNWVWSSIGESSFAPQYGYTTKASNDGDVKFLRTTDITSGAIDWNTVPYCLENPSDLEKYQLQDGDVVISRAGSVGFSFLVKNPPRSVFASYLIRFNPSVHREYFYLFLKSPFYWSEISESKIGIAVGNVNATKLKEIPLPLPPLNEQKRIVAKIEELFSEIDAGVASFQAAKAQLGVYRQSLLKQAFEGKLTEKWRAENPDKLEPAEQLLERIRQEREARYQQQLTDWQATVSEWEAAGKEGKKPAKPRKPKEVEPLTGDKLEQLGSLPKGWSWQYLADLGELARGKSKHRPRNEPKLFGGNYPFVQTGEVKAASKYIRSFSQTYSEFGLAQSKLWPVGTLCITIAANIAETAFLGIEACFPDSVVGFDAYDSGCDREYIELFIQSAKLRIEKFAPATAQKNINLTTLENLVVPVPSLSEQEEVKRILEAQFTAIEQNEAEIDAALQRSEALRQSILKKAFSGKLVPPACRQAGKTPLQLPQPCSGKWWVYVLECDDGSFYKGFTEDLPRRWKQHQAGSAAKWTKQHPPKCVFYYEEHWSESAALSREKYLKSGSGREWFRDEVVSNPFEYEPASVLLERIRAERLSAEQAGEAAEAELKATRSTRSRQGKKSVKKSARSTSSGQASSGRAKKSTRKGVVFSAKTKTS